MYKPYSKLKKPDYVTRRKRRYLPTVSFIIPCKNEEAVIYENISRCFAVDYPKKKIEVVAVNDGSTDKTLREMRRAQREYPNLKIIWWRKNRGKRHGMEEAIKQSSGEIIIQLDSDSYVKDTDFQKLIEPFADKSIGAVCAHADPTNQNKNLITRAQAGYYAMSFRILKAAESSFFTVLCCSGCCSAYRRKYIEPVMKEFVNQSFLGVNIAYGDDRSLTNLVLREGYRTIYRSDVQAFTIVPETLKQLIKQQVRWKKSWFINTTALSKYIFKIDRFIAFTYFFPLTIITLTTPIVAIYSILYFTVIHTSFPLFFLFGSLIVTTLFAFATSLLLRNSRHWFYLGVWGLINTFFISMLMPYALLTIRNGKWGTR